MKGINPREIDDIWSYTKAIDWSEPWLSCLCIFHISCFLSIILLRHHGNYQAVLFFPLLAVVYFSEYINETAAEHWREFSSEQYFDSQGLFISVVLSGPVLINCLIIVIMWVYFSGELFIKVKRAQIRKEMKSTVNSKQEAEDTKKSR